MQGISLSDPLADGTYHISFEKDKVWVGERKNSINDAIVYDYDRYTAEEIEALSEGDTIVTHLDGTENTTVLSVESIERKNDYVTINGGMEEGGIDLCKEEDHYRTLTWDDFLLIMKWEWRSSLSWRTISNYRMARRILKPTR